MLIFLSRLLLNPQSGAARRDTGNPWQMHRTIMRAFPDPLPVDERVLFRAEPAPYPDAPLILVQSVHEPDWSFLAADPPDHAYLRAAEGANPAVKPVHLDFVPGAALVFRLWANPTQRSWVPPTVRKNGPRQALLTEPAQLEWLQRKGAAAGFALVALSTTRTEFVDGRRPDAARRESMRLYGVMFNGRLRVLDPDKLARAVRDGVGPAKGLGFGLLSLAPAELA